MGLSWKLKTLPLAMLCIHQDSEAISKWQWKLFWIWRWIVTLWILSWFVMHIACSSIFKQYPIPRNIFGSAWQCKQMLINVCCSSNTVLIMFKLFDSQGHSKDFLRGGGEAHCVTTGNLHVHSQLQMLCPPNGVRNYQALENIYGMLIFRICKFSTPAL